ncbi:VOC family protein [Rhizobium leguminosarum]|uniref:VOC family protein n=1 Tax=Rhizobium leguminosarum TaxID=384 RepID=UPI001C90D9AB|nr:VOC family protein [Rhizobium leguminosarum]MBY2963732.1 VOC family protein [Rhizobium leguminosarum]
MATIFPFLWFNTQAEEARDFYLSVFRNAKKLGSTEVPDWVSGTNRTVPIATYDFALEDLRLRTFNAGPGDGFNDAVSFFIETRDQAETDYYWEGLTSRGGSERACGWLRDKFGVNWQVCPEITLRLIGDPDRKKAERTLQAMYKMQKIIIADLEAAYAG